MTIAAALLEALVKAARSTECDVVVLVGAGESLLRRLKPVTHKVVVAADDARGQQQAVSLGFNAVSVPALAGGSTSALALPRVKTALAAAINADLVRANARVVAGLADEQGELHSVLSLSAERFAEEHRSMLAGSHKTRLSAPLFELLLDIALRIGREGYEGRPVGSLIVAGDATRVMERSTRLVLNPFQGYSEDERNLFDPMVQAAVRQFSMMDGAFVVRDDGVVLAAGRHIRVGDTPPELPLGFGARHMAAAAVSLDTDALAFAISQTSGKVRVFERGRVLLELQPEERRGFSDRPPLVLGPSVLPTAVAAASTGLPASSSREATRKGKRSG